jgi:hypothetical protein
MQVNEEWLKTNGYELQTEYVGEVPLCLKWVKIYYKADSDPEAILTCTIEVYPLQLSPVWPVMLWARNTDGYVDSWSVWPDAKPVTCEMLDRLYKLLSRNAQ